MTWGNDESKKPIMYLNLKQAAKILGVSRQWVHVLLEQKKLNTVEIAGRRVIIHDQLFRAMDRARRRM